MRLDPDAAPPGDSISTAVGAGGSPAASPGRDEDPVALPLPGWDRYRILRLLGQGGMGRVYLARDPRLHREVAIKLVRGDAPEATRRLVVEARAQARVGHERVCKVYEVGEVEGQVYIAMQYVDGSPLGALAPSLTVEQKATIVREAALGVHEAHRAGILHRDLKPSNIMVERGEDGALSPYVMDFGLARNAGAEGATETGAVLGTPWYMAPEQARGEVGKLDRRADVYSLGASLYHLLTGEPPIPGSNALEVVSNVATVEPRAPRAIEPDIPVDLEAIVMRCLEKDRSARYDSARALAEDLDRFLRGDPVAARRAGTWYRLERRLRKHRRLVAAGSVALVLLGAALGWGIKTRSEAAARERLARRFTEQVERIEATARYSALSPLHDIRGDRREIQARMDELAAEIRRGGAAAVGPGNYALGRGYLALGDEAKAKEHLETAWQQGFREPRAAYALALVAGHLYQDKLREAERIEDKGRREAKKREIEGRYRDPALDYLQKSAGAEVPSTEYVAALIAFYEGRLDEALAHLDAIGAGLPWFYEAPELRGDILLSRAQQDRQLRGDTTQALADLDAARKALTAAAAIGESAPSVYQAMTEIEVSAMQTDLYGKGDVEPSFSRGVEAAARALAVDPDRYGALLLDAYLRRLMAKHRTLRGEPVDDLLATAVASADRAIHVDPSRPDARAELARVYRQQADARHARGQDPRASLQKAAEIAEGIAPSDRTYDDDVTLGLIFKIWADYEDDAGLDSAIHRGQAIDAYSRAIELDGRRADAFMDLGTNYYQRAAHPRSRDPDGDLALASAAFDRAKAIEPKHVVPYFYGGKIHVLRARRARARGEDPGPHLARAVAAYREGVAINPKVPHLHNATGTALLEEATSAWDRGADPLPLVDEARAAYEQAIAVAPAQANGYSNAGYALLERARFETARGDDPSASVGAAVAVLKQALARAPDFGSAWVNLGGAYALAAEHDLEEGRDPGPSLAEAGAAIDKALAHNPKDGEAWLYRGSARATEARFHARKKGGGRAEAFDDAAAAYQKAIDLSPEELSHALAFGHFCEAWASWRREAGLDPGPALGRGLDLAKRALAARPAWPDALVLQASLSLLQAETAGRAEEARDRAAQAVTGFSAALGANANLERRWRGRAAEAQQLAAAPR
jgi:serine/threonine-protein kinase